LASSTAPPFLVFQFSLLAYASSKQLLRVPLVSFSACSSLVSVVSLARQLLLLFQFWDIGQENETIALHVATETENRLALAEDVSFFTDSALPPQLSLHHCSSQREPDQPLESKE